MCDVTVVPLRNRHESTMPRVRIGIVLPEDEAGRLTLEIPDIHYAVEPSIGSMRSCKVTAHVNGSAVRLECGGEPLGDAGKWLIKPNREAGDRGITIRGVRAGRGFHWATGIDPVLPGELELRVVDGHLFVVNELPIETYLVGVITAEMSGACPIELLKAQAIAARSWMLAAAERKHADLKIDYCNDDCCQRFQGIGAATESARIAVEQTKGQVLLHSGGAVVDANYSKCCGGIVESPENVWGLAKPGLVSIVDAPPKSHLGSMTPVSDHNIADYVGGNWLADCDGYCSPNRVSDDDLPRYLGRVDDGGGHFRWSITQTADAIQDTIGRKFFTRTGLHDDRGLGRLYDLVVTRRGQSGRATRVDVLYDDRQGVRRTATIEDQYWIRHALHESFLFSSAFDVRIDRDATGWPTSVNLTGAGWGHGVGMCQIGALGMALGGCDHRRILHHYFKDVTIADYPK